MSERPEVLLETKRFRVLRHMQRLPDGTLHAREIVEHPGAVAILPVLDDGRVCLIRNERLAAGKVLIEIPAGTLERGEDPAHTAQRELVEETGYRAGSMQLLQDFYTSPGVLSERMYLFLARQLQPGPPAREAGEQIENLVVPWDEAMNLLKSGAIQDAKTLVGLLYFDRFRPRL